jgi:Transcriptional activator of glycolytic enzymes
MKKALQDEKSPLDANLESVLPGVHQWHQANHQIVTRLGDRVEAFAEVVAGGINGLVTKLDQIEERRCAQENRLAELLELGSFALRNGTSDSRTMNRSASSQTGTNTAGASPLRDAPMQYTTNAAGGCALSVPENEEDMHKSYRMRPKHKTLIDLYDEWIGEGDFKDDFGGIEGRNKLMGTKWRTHLTAYIYSRTERTIKGIRAFAKSNNITERDACLQLQEQYEKGCKSLVANMVVYFINKGLLPKRNSRGKSKISHSG